MANQSTSRIDELRGRLQKEPASIAFAQLAEEFRRAGRFREAIDVCRAGLKRHPGYLSARVTLCRALLARLDVAQHALSVPAERLVYDSGRGNYLGVARCVAAGVPQVGPSPVSGPITIRL